jgi:hypothetical protein
MCNSAAMNEGVILMVGLIVGAFASFVMLPVPQPVSCYEVVSIRPEQRIVVLFNACTGNIEIRGLALPLASQPAPNAPNGDSF